MSSVSAQQIFLTGATGFIGRAVLEQLAAGDHQLIVCLTRHPELLQPIAARHVGVRLIAGDLNEPKTYVDALAGSDVVVHLAAATGAASDTELERVNVDGTQDLLEASLARRVSKLLYVSSIAAGYADLSSYCYGRTKARAEELVIQSGVPNTILRPTIVLGERGPTWLTLRKLACLPLVPLFGGGKVEVQPVDVDDVVRAIMLLTNAQPIPLPVEIGGPEVVTFAALLRRIRAACGLSSAPFVSVPVAPVRALLQLASYLLPGSLPIRAGQLTPFVHDGTAETNTIYQQLRPSMSSLDTLLARLARAA